MAYCYFFLDIHICEERTFVVDAKGKDAVLIGKFKASIEYSAVGCFGDWFEIEAVKRGEHGELKLKSVGGRKGKGRQVAIGILRELDLKCLGTSCQY
jgi:hypothetical protein